MIGYQPGRSYLHGLDVRHKLAAVAIITLGSVYASLWGLLMWTVILVIACHSAGMRGWQMLKDLRWVWLLLAGVWVARALSIPGSSALTLGALVVSYEGMVSGTLICWRLVNIILLGLLLTATTRAAQITAAVEWLLNPVPGVPAQRVGTMLGLVVRFVPEFVVQAHEISAAQKARGIQGRKNPIYRLRHMALPLLRRTFETADELALAMQARCYADQRTARGFEARSRSGWALLAVGLICLLTLVI
jgi:energy-coupling factor transporter transmembrane protein EcfT